MNFMQNSQEFRKMYAPQKLNRQGHRFSYLNEKSTKLYVKYMQSKYQSTKTYFAYSVIIGNNISLQEIKITEDEINFLNNLISKKKQESFAEIRKNSRILAQGYRDSGSIFSKLPQELLVKMVSLTGDSNHHSEKEAHEIACNHFDAAREDGRLMSFTKD